MKNWLQSFFVARAESRLEQRLNKAAKDVEKSDRRLSDRTKEINAALESLTRNLASNDRRLRDIGESLLEDIQMAKATQQRYEEELESVRSENRILKEVTIPGLVAANKLMIERLDADTAVEVRRRTAG
jgi:uncharacterized protein (DUF342 family)